MGPDLLALIKAHILRYPKCELVDIYKLLYQSANGPKHFVIEFDTNKFYQQWEKAPAAEFSPTEAISADGKLVRVHLGPLRNLHINPDAIIEILLLTAKHYRPNPRLMIKWWKDIFTLIKDGILPFHLAQYTRLDEQFQEWGFIPMHHSKQYIKEYNPHYVVILKKFLEPLLNNPTSS
ncbi:hypothetical protein DRQ33_02745 [bacterium]|nr:MAG: hypothetical protein DRQ33_02745 [bacterium]